MCGPKFYFAAAWTLVVIYMKNKRSRKEENRKRSKKFLDDLLSILQTDESCHRKYPININQYNIGNKGGWESLEQRDTKINLRP